MENIQLDLTEFDVTQLTSHATTTTETVEPPKKTRAKKTDAEKAEAKRIKEEAKEALKKEKEEAKIAKKEKEEIEHGEGKLEHIMTIQKYLTNQRFADYLKKMGFKDSKTLHKKSIDELKMIVKEMHFAIQNRATNTMLDSFVKRGYLIAEGGITRATKYKINLAGMTDELWANQTFLDALEIVLLEYSSFARVSPMTQLVLCTLQTAMTRVAVNKIQSSINSAQSQEPAQNAPESNIAVDLNQLPSLFSPEVEMQDLSKLAVPNSSP